MSREADPCGAWQADLSALLDGELGPGRRAEVEAHLERCPRCSARLASRRRVDDLLAAAPLPGLPGGLAEKVLRGAAQPGPPRRWRPLAAPAFAALAAAAALALYLALRPRADGGRTGPEAPVALEPAQPPGRRAIPPAEEPPSTQIALPLLPPALPPAPAPELPLFEPEFEVPPTLLAEVRSPGQEGGASEGDLEAEAPEDLAVVLFGVERLDDFDVISNLEVAEQLVALERGNGR